jgi:PAS domain S-box-containing protein
MYTVLYVDDEPAELEIGGLFLERGGELLVVPLSSAAAALESLREQHYDAIVSDYQMPGMDGISFLQAVRREFDDIPFILFTGRGREEIAIAAINNGADRYVQKGGDPVTQYTELAHAIQQAILRRAAERTLRQGEERFRRLMDNARDLVYRMALPDGTYSFVSRAAVDLTGYEPEEFYADPGLLQRLVHPDWEDYLRSMRDGLLAGVVPPWYEYQIIDRAGRTRWINQRNVLVTDEEGRPIAIEGIATDVTRQKEAEQELRLSEQRFRRLFEQIPLGIAVVGPDLRFRMVNPALCRMLGYAEEELIDREFSDVTDPGDLPFSFAETGRVISGEVPFFRIEKRYRGKDGRTIRARVTVSPIRDEDGSVASLLPVIEALPDDGDGRTPS